MTRDLERCARALAVAVASSAVLGCGPVQYLSQVSMRASNALAQAEAAGAPGAAPYEYTMAREYYRKAREEAGESSFENAVAYGRVAEEMADKARDMAKAGPGTGQGEADGKDKALSAPAAGEPGR